MEISELIRLWREKKFLTQEKFAKNIGVDKATVSAWENGHKKIRSSNLKKILNFLDIDQDQFYSLEVDNLAFKGRTVRDSLRDGDTLDLYDKTKSTEFETIELDIPKNLIESYRVNANRLDIDKSELMIEALKISTFLFKYIDKIDYYKKLAIPRGKLVDISLDIFFNRLNPDEQVNYILKNIESIAGEEVTKHMYDMLNHVLDTHRKIEKLKSSENKEVYENWSKKFNEDFPDLKHPEQLVNDSIELLAAFFSRIMTASKSDTFD